MEAVVEGIGWVFGYILYPLLVVGTFLSMIVIIVGLVLAAGDDEAKIRRGIAAFLPVVTLTFMIARREQSGGEVPYAVQILSPFFRLVAGFILGAALVKLGELAAKADSEAGPSVYGLFVSSLCSFLLWSLIGGYLREIDMFVLGLLLGGGTWIVFVGIES